MSRCRGLVHVLSTLAAVTRFSVTSASRSVVAWTGSRIEPVRDFTDISRFRKSSGGLFTRRSGQVEITPGTNEPSAQSLASSLTDASLRNSPPQEQEDKLFVAVGKEFLESRSVLLWALRNSPRSKKFVLVHVHRPAKMIPMSKCFCS